MARITNRTDATAGALAMLKRAGVLASADHRSPAWQVRHIGPRAVRVESAGLARMAGYRNGRTPLARQRRALALAFAHAGYDVRTGARKTFRATNGLTTHIW